MTKLWEMCAIMTQSKTKYINITSTCTTKTHKWLWISWLLDSDDFWLQQKIDHRSSFDDYVLEIGH
jgi:hypothetical protein